MKKIAIVSHSFPSIYSPYDATFIEDHCNSLSEKFITELIVPTPYYSPFTKRSKKNSSPLLLNNRIKGNRIYYLSFPKKRFPQLIQASLSKNIISFFDKNRPDLIHIHFLYPSGLSITSIKKRYGIPIVVTMHGVDFYHTSINKKLSEITKNQLRCADYITVVGPGLYKDVLKSHPEVEHKLQIVYNHIDTSNFIPPTNDEKKMEKKMLGLDDSYFHLLCVANLRYKKGIDVLVKAVQKLDDKIKIKVHLIGRINDEPDYSRSIKSLIAKQHSDRFIIHGPKPRNEIGQWLSSADGFVLPSRNEPFGIALIEAMASGLPVISTKSGGPEAILNNNLGQLIDPDNIGQLTNAINLIRTNNNPSPQTLNNYIQEYFGKEVYIKRYSEIYYQLINSNR